MPVNQAFGTKAARRAKFFRNEETLAKVVRPIPIAPARRAERHRAIGATTRLRRIFVYHWASHQCQWRLRDVAA